MASLRKPTTTFSLGPQSVFERGELLCSSDAEFEPVIGRKPAFPIYLSCSDYGLFAAAHGYQPGRVHLNSCDPATGLFRRDLFETVQTQDVLFSPVTGEALQRAEPVLREVASQVRAIMIGNSPYETLFEPHPNLELPEARADGVRRCTEWVKQNGGVIRDLGGRPAFGLTHPQIISHAYWAVQHYPGGDPLLPVLQDLEALVICFCGGLMMSRTETCWPLPGRHAYNHRFADNAELDAWPFPKLSAWLRSVECWGGVEYLPGLQAGRDLKMAEVGFVGGVIGQLPNGSLDGS